MIPHSLISARRAFTLVEAIAAIVILAVAAPAMLWALAGSNRAMIDPVLADQARWLAIEKIEDVIADRASLTRGYTYLTGANYPAESAVSGFPGFSRSVSIVETGPSLSGAGTGYKTVAVNVGFADHWGNAQNFRLVTVITDYTP